ncbi:MAG: transglycosylase SLT domain-containing protein [Gemmatimonadales bacterium]|nr:MAG: transglycosylase SLT domain-containing protein [Gemmatimonadales bacterium]
MTCPIRPSAITLLMCALVGTGSGVLEGAGASPLRAQPIPATDAALEVAGEEIRTGRFWHAAELLEALGPLEPGGVLLLAEARAGFRDWNGVREALEAEAWLDSLAPVRGYELLGRAHEAAGEWELALSHYRTAAERSGNLPFSLAARLVRAELAVNGPESALLALERVQAQHATLVHYLAWELAGEASENGDPLAVASLEPFFQDGPTAGRRRDLLAAAVLNAGDSTRAEAIYRELANGSSGSEAARYRHQVAELTLARGDTTTAWELFRQALAGAPRTRAGMESAATLVDLGSLDRDLALQAAGALDRLGDGGRALRAYDEYVRLSQVAGQAPEVRARVERARIASTLPSRADEAVEEFRALDEHPDPAVGARVLDVWAGLRRRQGQAGNVRILRRWLVERYPDTDQAAQVVFLRGDDAQDRQDWDGALVLYRQVTAMAPARSLAGLAWMRIGQIHLEQGENERALEAYQGYLAAFPSGRRWSEASFWAGRILVDAGDTASATALLDRVMRDDPLSYYAAEAARLLARPFPMEMGPPPALDEPDWVARSLEELDLLYAAGLEEAATVHVEALVQRADREGTEAQYPVAEGLIVRGWTIEGINRGWALLRAGEEHNERLLAILYPFPQRDMVQREAREYGLDPILVAALIRQESAWDTDIVSSAGAIGLMQVMPPTGRQLARSVGPVGFTSESLEAAEVNLHLGGRFLRDMLDRYGPELPLVLSAYNAGPSRARRWSGFPEADDRLRFTERIPFTETRGYVKNVTRNVAIYRALYGDTLLRSASEQ